MNAGTLLHGEISSVVARIGHTETLVISDCGLPIRGTAQRIDLALKRGVPGFLETLDTVLTALPVERVTLASEIREASPRLLGEIQERFPGVEIQFVAHTEFKKRSESAVAVIRTGECTPYANIILEADVAFSER